MAQPDTAGKARQQPVAGFPGWFRGSPFALDTRMVSVSVCHSCMYYGTGSLQYIRTLRCPYFFAVTIAPSERKRKTR